MFWWLACVAAPKPGSPETGATETGDSGGADSDSLTGPVLWGCPEGMSPVPSDDPAWCIDTWERAEVDGGTVSAVGMVPLTGRTFEEAVAACEELVLDGGGEGYATAHLATQAEWEDAGDGVVGEGGTVWPWGDVYDASLCAIPTDEGEYPFDEIQLTGSMPGCVSSFGVFDQIGNAWEWVDSERDLDSADAASQFATAGITLAFDTDEAVSLVSGDPTPLTVDAAGVRPPTLTIAADGHLEIGAEQIEPPFDAFFARGYLRVEGVDAFLPVALQTTDPADEAAPWRVYRAAEYDGRRLPDKRGCAWYTGNSTGCTLSTSNYTHLPDFDGTIGFRCVAPPFAW